MKKQKIVLFDIDYTLFDVGYFYTELSKKLAQVLNIKESDVKKMLLKTAEEIILKEGHLNVEKFIKKIAAVSGKKEYENEIKKILFKSSFFKKGFYNEVEKSLKLITKIAKIGIFSKGDKKFQLAKIDQSGFKNYFDKNYIYIKYNKLKFLPFLKKKHVQDKVYLIDDKPGVIDEVKGFMPNIITIWLKRGKYTEQAKEIDGFKPDATVDNLLDVVKIVDKS